MRKIGLFFLLLSFPLVSMAQIYKCKGIKGVFTYQATACPSGQSEKLIDISIQISPEEARFNEAARAAGMTPEEAHRQLSANASNQTVAVVRPQATYSGPNYSQIRQQRENDCNERHDQLANHIRADYDAHRPSATADQLIRIERDRSICINGQ